MPPRVLVLLLRSFLPYFEVFCLKKTKKRRFFLATCRAKKKNAFSGPFYIAFLIERKTSFSICAKQSFLQKNSCYDIIFFSVVNDFSNVFRKIFNPFASFCMLASYARAQGRTRVYLLIHALNRFTKSYKNNRRLFRLGY